MIPLDEAIKASQQEEEKHFQLGGDGAVVMEKLTLTGAMQLYNYHITTEKFPEFITNTRNKYSPHISDVTFFLRMPSVFADLKNVLQTLIWASEELAAGDGPAPERRLSCLSVGCHNGLEVYSIHAVIEQAIHELLERNYITPDAAGQWDNGKRVVGIDNGPTILRNAKLNRYVYHQFERDGYKGIEKIMEKYFHYNKGIAHYEMIYPPAREQCFFAYHDARFLNPDLIGLFDLVTLNIPDFTRELSTEVFPRILSVTKPRGIIEYNGPFFSKNGTHLWCLHEEQT